MMVDHWLKSRIPSKIHAHTREDGYKSVCKSNKTDIRKCRKHYFYSILMALFFIALLLFITKKVVHYIFED